MRMFSVRIMEKKKSNISFLGFILLFAMLKKDEAFQISNEIHLYFLDS